MSSTGEPGAGPTRPDEVRAALRARLPAVLREDGGDLLALVDAAATGVEACLGDLDTCRRRLDVTAPVARLFGRPPTGRTGTTASLRRWLAVEACDGPSSDGAPAGGAAVEPFLWPGLWLEQVVSAVREDAGGVDGRAGGRLRVRLGVTRPSLAIVWEGELPRLHPPSLLPPAWRRAGLIVQTAVVRSAPPANPYVEGLTLRGKLIKP